MSAYHPGARIYIRSGPYAGLHGVVDAHTADGLLVTLASQPGQSRRLVCVMLGDVYGAVK